VRDKELMQARGEEQTRATLAARLKEARERAGLTQSQVARLLKMHRPTITEIEAGNRTVAAEELPTFADLYGVSTEWLLDRVDESEEMTVELAARGLDKLSPADRARLVEILRSLPRSP
jgi:transcriptional regulator with XRE-family HTH domain